MLYSCVTSAILHPPPNSENGRKKKWPENELLCVAAQPSYYGLESLCKAHSPTCYGPAPCTTEGCVNVSFITKTEALKNLTLLPPIIWIMMIKGNSPGHARHSFPLELISKILSFYLCNYILYFLYLITKLLSSCRLNIR